MQRMLSPQMGEQMGECLVVCMRCGLKTKMKESGQVMLAGDIVAQSYRLCMTCYRAVEDAVNRLVFANRAPDGPPPEWRERS